MKDKDKKIKMEITEDAEKILSYNRRAMGCVWFENNIRLLESIKERELPSIGYFNIAGDHLNGLLGNIEEAEMQIDTLKNLIEDYRIKNKNYILRR